MHEDVYCSVLFDSEKVYMFNRGGCYGNHDGSMECYTAHKILFIQNMPYYRQFINYVKFFRDIMVPLYHGSNYVKITISPQKKRIFFPVLRKKPRRSSNQINQGFIFE